MKKTAASLSILVILASCAKEMNAPSATDAIPTETFRISAESGTKTFLADMEGSAVHWSEDDAVAVFDEIPSCPGHAFTSEIDATDSTVAVFSGQVCTGATDLTALYPYDKSATYSDGILTTAIPAVQNAVEGSFSNNSALSAARIQRTPGQDSASASFANLCAVLGFNIPSYISDVTSVVITPNGGNAICGNVSIDTKALAIKSVSGGESVTVCGSFTAGGRYYACIAPSTYEGGFTLTVNTESGSSYSCRTTKTLDAKASNIYHLGTAGLVLDLVPNVTIKHTTDTKGNLNGSEAVLSIDGAESGLGAKVTLWDVTLLDSSSNEVRKISSSNGTMSMVNGWTYIPQGKYTVKALYTLPDGKVKQLVAQATSPAPEFTVTTSGYASYDRYAATNGMSKDITAANACEANTIYALSASVSISNDIITDSKYSSLFSYNLDNGYDTGIITGNTISLDDKSGLSIGTHSFIGECSFDGVKKSQSRTIHITGLPHIANPPSNQGLNPWSKMEGSISWGNEYVECASKSQADYPRIGSPYFNIPADINVKVSPYIVRGGWYSTLGTYYLRISLNSDDCMVQKIKFSKGDVFQTEFTYTMTSSLNRWRVQYNYAATGVNMQVYRFNIYYN